MQPYLFPYIGYFQLIHAVDLFVIFDDVNYIKKGWINRNRILLNGKDHLFTLPIVDSSQNKLINEVDIFNGEINKNNILSKVRHAYSKASEFKNVFDLIADIILYPENNLCHYIANSITQTCKYLGLNREFKLSSKIPKDAYSKGIDKLISICKSFGSDVYVNPIGGIELYKRKDFNDHDIELFFLQTKPFEYQQFDNKFIPNLSIIDLIMFNSKKDVVKCLEKYKLIH